MMGRKSAARVQSMDLRGVTPGQLVERGIGSVQELHAVLAERAEGHQRLSRFLKRRDVPGPEKYGAQCAFVHEHGRLPFQCSGCWLLPGFCVCGRLVRAAPRTKVVVHLHHDEWGRGSNTGCLCAASLAGCQLLLRGYAPHDAAFEALLADTSHTTALLWPSEDALEPQQLRELAERRSGGRIALVAIDATWHGAKRMRHKYPPGMLTVRLPPELALPDLKHSGSISSMERLTRQMFPGRPRPAADDAAAAAAAARQRGPRAPPRTGQAAAAAAAAGEAGAPAAPEAAAAAAGAEAGAQAPAACPSGAAPPRAAAPPERARQRRPRVVPAAGEPVSLLRLIRKYNGKAASNGRVSTLEAVAAALLALEGDAGVYEGQLHNLKLKVDAVRTQKHMPAVYGLYDADDDGDDGSSDGSDGGGDGGSAGDGQPAVEGEGLGGVAV